MGEEIAGAEADGRPGEVARGTEEVGRDDVMRVLGQFVLGERVGDIVDRGGADDQQEQPADHLEDPVETLEGDAHQAGAIRQIPALEAVH